MAMDAEQVVENVVRKSAMVLFKDVMPVVIKLLPEGNVVEEVVVGAMHLQIVQDEIASLEQKGADWLASEAGAFTDRIAKAVEGVAKAHPIAGDVLKAVESPTGQAIISEVEQHLGPVLTGAIKKLFDRGDIGKLEGWLKSEGVL